MVKAKFTHTGESSRKFMTSVNWSLSVLLKNDPPTRGSWTSEKTYLSSWNCFTYKSVLRFSFSSHTVLVPGAGACCGTFPPHTLSVCN